MIELNPQIVEACITGIKHVQDNIYEFDNTRYEYIESRMRNTRVYELIFKEQDSYKIVICIGGSHSASAIKYDGFNRCKVSLTEKARELLRVAQQTYYYEKGRKLRRAEAIKARKKKKCPVCGKLFIPTHNKTCCSYECAYKYSLAKAQTKRDANIPTYHKVCPICGKPFGTHHDGQRYCSAKCRIKRNNQYLRARIIENTYSVKKCLNCGKEFYGTPRQVHCCATCREEYAYNRIKERRQEAKKNLVQTSK